MKKLVANWNKSLAVGGFHVLWNRFRNFQQQGQRKTFRVRSQEFKSYGLAGTSPIARLDVWG